MQFWSAIVPIYGWRNATQPQVMATRHVCQIASALAEKNIWRQTSLQPWYDTKQKWHCSTNLDADLWFTVCAVNLADNKSLDVFCNTSFGRNDSCQTFPVAPKSLSIFALGNCADLQLSADEGLVKYAGWRSSAAPSMAQILNISTWQPKFVSSENRPELPKSYNYLEQTIFKQNIPLEEWTKLEIRLVTISSKKTGRGRR